MGAAWGKEELQQRCGHIAVATNRDPSSQSSLASGSFHYLQPGGPIVVSRIPLLAATDSQFDPEICC